MESLYELWGKRNPEWEVRYQDSIINVLSDYGKGTSGYTDVRGKIFGAGYEVFILAFFIGLYHNQTKPLIEYYSANGLLKSVNGLNDIDVVFADIEKILG